MMLSQPITSKQPDGVLRVIIPGRISEPTQDPESISSQHEDADVWLRRVYSGEMNVIRLGEQASGWLANRESMVEAEKLIKSGQVDLVLATELREIYRNPAFHWKFIQDCIDNEVRVILIADCVDTEDENWEIMMYAASMRHGMTVPEARRRVRRKATYSFSRGGMVLKVKFGYRKLTREEAASGQYGPVGLRIAKVPEWTAIIREMRERVMRGESYEQVAQWLNEEGIPPGPYATGGRWSGKLVKELLRDPILSGQRTFRDVVHTLHYGSGEYLRRRNKVAPELKQYPELAHVTPDEQSELWAVMDARKDGHSQPSGRESPLWNKSRSRSLWPNQHPRCICSAPMHGCGDFLKCKNALPGGPRSCWNHVQVYYPFIRSKVLRWVRDVAETHPGFRNVLAESAWEEFEYTRRRRDGSEERLDKEIAKLEKEAAALAKAIRKGGELEALLAELSKVEKELSETREQKARVTQQNQLVGGFASREEVAARLDVALERLTEVSLDFADLMRRLIPEFVIQPVQALDCPLIRPRGKLTMRLDAWADGKEPPPPVSVALDLFEAPVHIRHMAACVAARKANPNATLREIAAQLEINYMTVKRALSYARLMEKEGVTDPYKEIHSKPECASRWKKRANKPGRKESA